MTALVLNSLNFSTNLFEKIFDKIWVTLTKTLQGMMIGVMVARQTQANQYIAQQMIKYGEYRQDDYYHLLHELNRKTISNIHKEVTSE